MLTIRLHKTMSDLKCQSCSFRGAQSFYGNQVCNWPKRHVLGKDTVGGPPDLTWNTFLQGNKGSAFEPDAFTSFGDTAAVVAGTATGTDHVLATRTARAARIPL